MKCDNITAAVRGMSPEQKQAILRTGFGSILQVNITSYLRHLSYYLLDVYDSDSRRLVQQYSVIEITEQTIHDMMGLPISGEDINELPLCDKGNQILEEWRGQYPCDKFNGEEYLRRIQSTSKDNLIFSLIFLNLFVYVAVLEHNYGLILNEKSTMEVALKDGLEKFPNSVVLNEWMENMNELFREVHEGENNKKVVTPQNQ
ncbi:unnamed protein product [Lactuca saligna]|uniref:Uncharacterized protein n=1 Tax=Lactuca saligna TaxID=75948 RepID=A0AA35Z4C3_LACSI|nr:unnamed protein product [Lactuca saligna]